MMALEAIDLTKTFVGGDGGLLTVLDGVSLQVEQGEMVAIVGASGAGKSTLLHLLGALDRPTRGRVIVSGEALEGLSDEALAALRNRQIGFVFQFHHLLREFSAHENVMIPMRRLGHMNETEMRERAAALLEAVDLGDKLRRLSRHLSGGEQQRVAIARALANDPHVILADEPTGNLDTGNSQRAFELLANLVREREKALLLVTHNRFIADACDWIHEMKDGRIIVSHPHGQRISV